MDPFSAIGAIGGAAVSGLFGSRQADKQAKLQKQFAKSGIQWKVADAKKAGVHPLYALGAQTTPYSPVSVGTPDFTSAGQQLGRALYQGMDSNERASAQLQLENASLQNEYLRAQIASTRASVLRSVGPSIPSGRTVQLIDGQSATEKIEPPQITTHSVDPLLGRVIHAPHITDAQTEEDRYGETPFPFNYYVYLSRKGADLAYTREAYRKWSRRTGNYRLPHGMTRDPFQFRNRMRGYDLPRY